LASATARSLFHSFTHETTDDAFVDVHTVSVAPKVAGHVAVVRVDDNQLVKKGDVLVEIDPRDFQVALAQAKANLARDKATQIQAELNEKRALDLFSRKVISTQERDTNVATAESSRASVQADEAAVEQAELNLGHSKIKAPIDGYVTKEAVATGDYVQVGQALMSLVPPRVWVIANFKETQLRTCVRATRAMFPSTLTRSPVTRTCRQHSGWERSGFQFVAAGKCDGQLCESSPTRAGEDRAR
jgi:membrane fusion protein (multidrug efflux system)